jgi:GNAT superfamily N-acetyltransferase
MREACEIEIRLLEMRDLAGAMRLKELARWNQTESDWRRLIRLEPRGCFCASLDGRVVGTTTTTTYGNELAWVGMVLVDPEHRRRGVATRLMETALDYLDGRVAAVKLDATTDGRPVYERFGFRVESLVERWMGTARVFDARGAACETFEPSMRGELLALDREAFGVDRSKLIESLLTDACVAPMAATADGRLTGYALARRGSSAAYVGPLVASDAKQAALLLDGLLSQLAGERIYVDLNTNFGRGAEVLAARGFVKQRDLVRMAYGAQSSAASSESVFAIAGPEVG